MPAANSPYEYDESIMKLSPREEIGYPDPKRAAAREAEIRRVEQLKGLAAPMVAIEPVPVEPEAAKDPREQYANTAAYRRGVLRAVREERARMRREVPTEFDAEDADPAEQAGYKAAIAAFADEAALDSAPQSDEVLVSVDSVDTGVEYEHPDWAG